MSKTPLTDAAIVDIGDDTMTSRGMPLYRGGTYYGPVVRADAMADLERLLQTTSQAEATLMDIEALATDALRFDGDRVRYYRAHMRKIKQLASKRR